MSAQGPGNGPPSAGMGAQGGGGGGQPAPAGQTMSQQNLNQIVSEPFIVSSLLQCCFWFWFLELRLQWLYVCSVASKETRMGTELKLLEQQLGRAHLLCSCHVVSPLNNYQRLAVSQRRNRSSTSHGNSVCTATLIHLVPA